MPSESFVLKQNRKTKQLNVRQFVKGSLNDRINGLKFLSAILQHKKLEIGDLEISFQKTIFKDDFLRKACFDISFFV